MPVASNEAEDKDTNATMTLDSPKTKAPILTGRRKQKSKDTTATMTLDSPKTKALILTGRRKQKSYHQKHNS